MFMQLKAPLVAGSQIPVTLQFKNAQGQTLEHPVQVPVQALGQTTSGHGHAMPSTAHLPSTKPVACSIDMH